MRLTTRTTLTGLLCTASGRTHHLCARGNFLLPLFAFPLLVPLLLRDRPERTKPALLQLVDAFPRSGVRREKAEAGRIALHSASDLGSGCDAGEPHVVNLDHVVGDREVGRAVLARGADRVVAVGKGARERRSFAEDVEGVEMEVDLLRSGEAAGETITLQ